MEGVRRILGEAMFRGPIGERDRRGAFWLFIKYGTGVTRTRLGSWLYEPLHKPFCDYLEAKLLDWLSWRSAGIMRRQRVIACCFRSFAKSWIGTKGASAWAALWDPDLAVLIDSVDAEQSKKFLSSIKEMISGGDQQSLWAWCYGSWYSKDRPWAATQVVHAARRSTARQEPSWDTTSVTAGAVGNHPDFLIIDDPIAEEKLNSDANFLEVVERHMVAMIPVTRGDAFILLIGTRYRDRDAIGTALAKEGVYEVCGMPPTDDRIVESKDGLWSLYWLDIIDEAGIYGKPGASAMPTSWTEEDLRAYERRDPVAFNSQMRNRPDVGTHAPLTYEQVQKMVTQFAPKQTEVILSIHVDTAFLDTKRIGSGDSSVMEVWGHYTNGSGKVIYLWGKGGPNYNSSNFADMVVTETKAWIAQGYKILCITDELEVSGKQGSWRNALKERFRQRGIVAPPIKVLKRYGPDKKKMTRILNALSYWQAGDVELYADAPGLANLMAQAARVWVSRRDWIDCASDVFDHEVRQPFLNRITAPDPMPRPTDLMMRNPNWIFHVDEMQTRNLYDAHVAAERQAAGKEGYWTRQPIGPITG